MSEIYRGKAGVRLKPLLWLFITVLCLLLISATLHARPMYYFFDAASFNYIINRYPNNWVF